MKKILYSSVFALSYVINFKIIGFNFGGIVVGTILEFSLPFFILFSYILFAISFYGFHKERFNFKSTYFKILICNLITIILTLNDTMFFLDPFNW